MFRTSVEEMEEKEERQGLLDEDVADQPDSENTGDEKDEWRKGVLTRIMKFVEKWEDEDEIPYDKFAKLCIGAVVDVLQTVLKFEVDLFTGVDSSTIFCKVRAKEDNLKIHAELIEYHVQLRRFATTNEKYMQINPYAEFKKNKRTKNGKKMIRREAKYRRYNKYNIPVKKD